MTKKRENELPRKAQEKDEAMKHVQVSAPNDGSEGLTLATRRLSKLNISAPEDREETLRV